jgi:hypothetical protein
MKVLDLGHAYSVDGYPHDHRLGELTFATQLVEFVKKVGDNFPGNRPPEHSGTNCQEILRVLIDRVKYLNQQKPSEENLDILLFLRLSLYKFEKRAARLKGVSFSNTSHIEELEPCKICGHIFDHDRSHQV